MKKKQILGMFFLLGALVFYYLYLERKEQKSIENNRVLPIDKQGLQSFRLRNDYSEFEFAREGENWRLKKPIQDLGDQDNINRLLDFLLTEQVQQKILLEKDKSEYGFSDKTSLLFDLKWQERELGLEVSALEAFGNQSFLYRKGFDKDDSKYLFIGDGFWYQELNKKLLYFRDKKVVPEDLPHVNRVALLDQNKEVVFKLSIRDNQWWFDDGSDRFAVKDYVMKDFFQSLRELKALDLTEEDYLDEKQLVAKGLQPARNEFVIGGNNLQISILVGKEEAEKIFLWRKDRQLIYQCFANASEFIFSNRVHFLDPYHPFRLDRSQVLEIHYKSPSRSQILVKKDGAWFDANNKKHTASMSYFFRLLRNLESLDLLEKPIQSDYSLQFKNNEKNEILSLDWQIDNEKVYFKSSVSKYVAVVNLKDIEFFEKWLVKDEKN